MLPCSRFAVAPNLTGGQRRKAPLPAARMPPGSLSRAHPGAVPLWRGRRDKSDVRADARRTGVDPGKRAAGHGSIRDRVGQEVAAQQLVEPGRSCGVGCAGLIQRSQTAGLDRAGCHDAALHPGRRVRRHHAGACARPGDCGLGFDDGAFRSGREFLERGCRPHAGFTALV